MGERGSELHLPPRLVTVVAGVWVSSDPGPAGVGAGDPWVPHPPLRLMVNPWVMIHGPNRPGVRPGPNSRGPGDPAGRLSGQGGENG
jgi:hypothetical protein